MKPVQNNRRTLATRTLAIISALLLTLSMACGNASTPEGEGGGDQVGGEGTPSEVKNPGVFVHSLGGEPESLDPARPPPTAGSATGRSSRCTTSWSTSRRTVPTRSR